MCVDGLVLSAVAARRRLTFYVSSQSDGPIGPRGKLLHDEASIDR
jgi:hypothetical protein